MGVNVFASKEMKRSFSLIRKLSGLSSGVATSVIYRIAIPLYLLGGYAFAYPVSLYLSWFPTTNLNITFSLKKNLT